MLINLLKLVVLVVLPCGALVGQAVAAPDPYREYLDKYRCPVADRLSRLYDAGDPAVDRDRFLVITLVEHKFGYVQCLFQDKETTLYCEAASGFWYDKPDVPRRMFLAPAKIAALARLGFSTDGSKGNFHLDIAVPAPVDFTRIADLMLQALYDGYDARVDKTLTFVAPFAPGLVLACDPVG